MDRQTPVPAVITAAAFKARWSARLAAVSSLEECPTSTTVPAESRSQYARNCSSKTRLPQLFTRALLRSNSTSGNRIGTITAFLITSIVVVAVPSLRLSTALAVIVTVFLCSALFEGSNCTVVESNRPPSPDPSDAVKRGDWIGPPHWPSKVPERDDFSP